MIAVTLPLSTPRSTARSTVRWNTARSASCRTRRARNRLSVVAPIPVNSSSTPMAAFQSASTRVLREVSAAEVRSWVAHSTVRIITEGGMEGRVGGWPWASQPPAPTDPGVTVSRHRALLTSRSERTNPSPMGEQAGFSLEEPGPPPLEPLVGPQPPVLLPSPAPQVEADAPEEGIHLRLPHHRLGNHKRLVLGLWHVPSIPPGAGAPVDRTEHPW